MADENQFQFSQALGDFLADPFGIQSRRESERAREAVRANQQQALTELAAFERSLSGLEAPFSEGTIGQMTTQQRDITGASAANELAEARRLAGASGLGRGGALGNRERLIREEMARRNAATAQNIRAQAARENNAFQQALAAARGNITTSRASILSGSPVDLTGTAQPTGGPGMSTRAPSNTLASSLFNERRI